MGKLESSQLGLSINYPLLISTIFLMVGSGGMYVDKKTGGLTSGMNNTIPISNLHHILHGGKSKHVYEITGGLTSGIDNKFPLAYLHHNSRYWRDRT